jgi:hypothetical protein
MDEKNALLEKLEYLRKEHVITASATQKFELKKHIEELEKRLEEINNSDNSVPNDDRNKTPFIQNSNPTESKDNKTFNLKMKQILIFSLPILFFILYKIQFYEVQFHEDELGFTQEQADKFKLETDSIMNPILDSEWTGSDKEVKQALSIIVSRRDSILDKIELNSLNTWRLYHHINFYCKAIESQLKLKNDWATLEKEASSTIE